MKKLKRLLLASILITSSTANTTNYFDWVFRAGAYASAAALATGWVSGIKNGQINNNTLLASSLLCTCLGAIQATPAQKTDNNGKVIKQQKPDIYNYAARWIAFAGFASLIAWAGFEGWGKH